MPTNKRKHSWETLYVPQSMRELLMYGTFNDSDPEESFDAWLIKIHPGAIIREWEKFRDQLYPTWTHKDVMPYGECLALGLEPDRAKLREICLKERTNDKQ